MGRKDVLKAQIQDHQRPGTAMPGGATHTPPGPEQNWSRRNMGPTRVEIPEIPKAIYISPQGTCVVPTEWKTTICNCKSWSKGLRSQRSHKSPGPKLSE